MGCRQKSKFRCSTSDVQNPERPKFRMPKSRSFQNTDFPTSRRSQNSDFQHPNLLTT